ncbi:hypothetical protein [Bifidobacterium longum]|uniref:hypothetical protein n=1 Tax=Bifidobacterium longum TaxID=216816 RepID=UPI0018D0533A|nr:hypothetical protein [Bifidobacterium longum]MBH0364312.1 hypothetical protein [Bifidobacterium longum]MBM5830500.1 hypothetical protein [Bifidobacterium longum subsp. suillum]QSG86181.1 hypothetical protein BLS995_05645 [Bifidobacterium longum subsp. suillum]QXT30636.1 hypothetical protein BLS605_06480 [Bifidobacterium longum subsp. suillum]
MQLNKHNVETPPRSKPGWLRKTVAAVAALATLATGGVVASTAYAEGDTGGGGVAGGGPTGGGVGASHLEWTYKDGGTGWGPASDWNSTKAAMTAMGWHNLDDSEGGSSVAWMQQATSQANANCIARVKSKYPDAPEDPNMCRVVGVGAVGTPGKQFGYGAGASHSIWMNYWHQVVDNVQFTNGSSPYYTKDAFSVDPSLSVDKIADTWAPDLANGVSTGTIVVIALSRYEPAPMAFTPTISTNAPHIIQEGQPITDKVTVDVKPGDHWIDGTSVTAKGYYFTGSKDAILKSIPYNGDPTDAGITNYLNQIRSAGGTQLGTKTETFTGPGQHTVTLDQKAPANTWGTWVWFINKNAIRKPCVVSA